MRKTPLGLLLTLACTTLFALTPLPTQERPSIPPPKSEIQYPNNTTQPVNCFDYYKFGSVYASLETKNYTNISGTKINFFGEIKNENSYPIVNGKLFVKIMRQNDTYDKTGGQDEVDSFVVKDNISIKANSSIPVTFDWQIPAYALSGEYQASTYFIIDDSFSMSGLSFTTDIVGGVAKFFVKGEQKTTVYFDRTKIQLNKNDYRTVAFTPSMKTNENANIELTLTNSTDTIQRVPVLLELYVWGSQKPRNLLRSEERVVLIAPRSSIKVPYVVEDSVHSVYYVLAKASYQDLKSEVAVRFVRAGKQEPKIAFSTFLKYPITKGQENNLITCVNNTNSNNADYGKVVTSLYNYKGREIFTSKYEGSITSAIQGMQAKFIPKDSYKDTTLETKIYDKEGNIIDETKIFYKCSDLSDDCKESVFLDVKMVLAVLGILVILGIVFFILRRFKKRNMALSLIMFLILGALVMPHRVEGKEQTWYSGVISGFLTTDDWATGENITPWIVADIWMSVKYAATAFNLTKNVDMSTDSDVNFNDRIRFTFLPFLSTDTDWFGVGGTVSSPNGDWVTDAVNTMDMDLNKYVMYSGVYNMSYNLVDRSFDDNGASIWGQFSVNPPAKSLENGTSLTCDPMVINGGTNYIDCTVGRVTVATNITPVLRYSATYAKFYFFWMDFSHDLQGGGAGKHNYESIPFIQTIDAQEIEFPLTIQPVDACQGNDPPTAPSITLTPDTVTVDQETTITFSSTDAQNDPITYQIDWGDGAITTATSPTTKSWTTVGTKTIKVRATDACRQSAWTTKTIVVNALPVLDALTVTADPTCGSVVLNWNNNTATSYQVFRKEGNGGYVAVSPILTITTTTTYMDTSIADRHTYTYKIWSQKDTLEKYSNEVNATPTCPCLPPRVINTSDGICHDPITATCVPSLSSISTGQSVTWTANNILGGTGVYFFSWSGTDNLTGTTNPLSKIYTTVGSKTASVLITSGSQTKTVSCPVVTVAIDLCLNFEGIQTTVPTGFTRDAAGNCLCAVTNYTLTVTKAGTGTGSVSSTPIGITCGADCSELYPAATAVALTADPAEGSTFTGWSGHCNASGQVTMNADKTCTATFTAILAPSGTLTASPNPCTITAGNSTCTTTLTATTANLTANPTAITTLGRTDISVTTSPQTVANVVVEYNNGNGRNFFLYHNGEPSLASVNVTAVCARGSTWDGTKCAASGPSGTLTASPNPCTITAGNSTCTTTLTATTANLTANPTAITTLGRTDISVTTSPQTVANVVVEYNNGNGRNFFLYHNGEPSLASVNVTAVCARGSTWDGTKCAASGPSGTLTASPNPCTITAGNSTCTTTLTATTANLTANPTAITTLGRTDISVTTSPQTVANVVVEYNNGNGRNFFLYHNGEPSLASVNVTAVCARGSTWDGTKCAASGPSGTLTASPNPCTITAGNSTCTTTLTATTANLTANPTAITTLGRTDISVTTSPQTVANVVVEYNNGNGRNFFLYHNGEPSLASVNVTAVCARGSTWDGTKCAASGPTYYTVTYNANGATGNLSAAPASYEGGDEVTVLGKGNLVKGTETFGGWKADVNGITYQPTDTFNMFDRNVILLAQWNGAVTPGSTDGCFSDNTISKNLNSSDPDVYYKPALIQRIQASTTPLNDKRGYLLSDISRKTQTLDFQSRLAGNINTYIKSQYCSTVLNQTLLNKWNDNRPADAANMKLSTRCSSARNTNGYYYYEGIGGMKTPGRLLTVNLTSATSSILDTIDKPTVLYVVGANVQIDTNISYSTGGTPSLVIIVRKDSNNKGGNIYINPEVTHIDATLIADGAMMNGVAGVSQNWIDPLNNLNKRLLINGKLFTYNTRGGSLKVDVPGTDVEQKTPLGTCIDSTLISNNCPIGTCIDSTLISNNCPITTAAAQDLERFRMIPSSDPSVLCSLHVTGNIPVNRPDILTTLAYD